MIREVNDFGVRKWLEPFGDSVVGRWRAWCTLPVTPCLWYGPERGWEPVKEKK